MTNGCRFRVLALITAVLLTQGCIPFNYNGTARIYRDRSNIRQNILITGQPQRKFQSIWGPPTRTYSRHFDRGAHGEIAWTPFGGGGSIAAHGGESYDLWFYEKKQVTLVFENKELIYWHWGADPPDDSKAYQMEQIK
jgi:hypothetical protein